MGLPFSGSGHHRRRSSARASANIGPSHTTTSVNADGTEDADHRHHHQQYPSDFLDVNNTIITTPRNSTPEEQKPLDDTDSLSDLSSLADSVTMDYISSDDDDDLHDDEETGLTAKQRRQRRRRRQQRRQLDARIAGVKASRQDGGSGSNVSGGAGGSRLADLNVAKRLLTNAVLIGLWYFFSLSISIYNKWMFSDAKGSVVFPFPLFTTSMHMVVQFSLSCVILYVFPSLRPRHPPPSDDPDSPPASNSPLITRFFYLSRLVPCGVATSLDIGLGNMSLKFITLTFLTMCKSSALAFVLLFAFVFRLETPSIKLILVIAAMTVGVIMMVAGEAAFNAVGFGLIIASAFFSGFRWGLTQILLLRHPATSNPFSTLFLLTPIMLSSLIVIALAVEGPAEITNGLRILIDANGIPTSVLFLVFPGVLAFCMIASEFALLKRSSVVTLSICGIFKEVVTISAAGVVFHDKLTPVNVSGLVVTIASIASYNYMKISKMRRESQEEFANRNEHFDTDSPQTGVLAPSSSSPTFQRNHNNNAAPAGDLMSGRNSIRARASGTSSAMQSLTVPVSVIDQDRQLSPRLVPQSSPLRPGSANANAPVSEIEPLSKVERPTTPRI